MKAFKHENVLIEKEYTDLIIENKVMPLHLGFDGPDIGHVVIKKSTEEGLFADIYTDTDLTGHYPAIRIVVHEQTSKGKILAGTLNQVIVSQEPNVQPEIVQL